jgi:hypothetical protein
MTPGRGRRVWVTGGWVLQITRERRAGRHLETDAVRKGGNQFLAGNVELFLVNHFTIFDYQEPYLWPIMKYP